MPPPRKIAPLDTSPLRVLAPKLPNRDEVPHPFFLSTGCRGHPCRRCGAQPRINLVPVINDSPVDDARERREHVRRQLPGRHDVLDGPTARDQIVRDNSPMASPPQSFRTHVRSPVRSPGECRRISQFAHAIFKIHTLRVVRVRSKSGKLPRDVRRIDALRAASAAEPLDPSILDLRALERGGQFRLVELRPSLRAGKRSNVGDDCDAMLAEQFEESLDRMRRVSDREDQRGTIARWRRLPSSPTPRF